MGTVTHKLLLFFLLLCFQTQTLAAVAISCVHGGSGADTVTDGCHPPATAVVGNNGSEPPEAPCFDCHKCQLGCAFGVAALPDGRSIAIAPDGRPVTGRISVRHFYRFVPDPLQRPPILALS